MEIFREKALAKLSIAALALDFLIIVALWKLGRDLLPETRGFYAQTLRTWYWLGIPLGLVLHLLVCEVVFNGWSVGRFCCGLSLSHKHPASATVGWRMKRFFSILTRFGLGSLNPNHLPGYNCAEDLVFRSDLAGQAPTRSKIEAAPRRFSSSRPQASPPVPAPAPNATAPSLRPSNIEVIAGPHTGTTIDLKSGRSFTSSGIFRIGRDPAWADLALSRDGKVSSQHCLLTLRDGRLVICDGSGNGRPSTNGTTVDAVPVSSNKAHALGRGATISLGNSVLKLH